MNVRPLFCAMALIGLFASPVCAQGLGDIRLGAGYVPRVLVDTPGPHGSAGIAVAPDGRLWVTSILDHTIRVLDPRTGHIVSQLGYTQGLRTPDDVVIAPDGRAFWTEFLTGRVMQRTASGAISMLANVGPGADGIALSPGGRLFVGRFLAGDELFEIDTTGATPPRVVRSGLVGMEGITIGPGGAIYASLIFTGQVARIDPDSGAISIVLDGLDAPIDVDFDRRGVLYVAENGSGRVVRANSSGGVTLFAQGRVGIDNLAFGRDGTLYVSNAATGGVDRVWHGAMRPLMPGGLSAPGGIATIRVGGQLRAYVADVASTSAYGLLTGWQLDFEGQVAAPPTAGISLPLNVGTFGSNLVYSSWITNSVQVWNPATHTVLAAYSDFAVPSNAIGMNGDLIVAEAGTGTVSRVRPNGVRDVVASGLFLPSGLATDGDDLWVADWASGVVFKIIEDGTTLAAPVPVASGLAAPEGLSIDRHGDLLVVETGARRLSRIRSSDGSRSIVAENLPLGLPGVEGALPTWTFNGVTTDPFGTIYLSLDVSAQILQIFDFTRE